MIFSSSLFLVYFLPIFLAVYHVVPKLLKNYVILLASIFFYAWGAPKFVFVILGSILINFFLVKLIHERTEKRTRKLLLFASVFLNLGLLAYFKYANFFIENLNLTLNSMGFDSVSWIKIALPIGISFFTFQSLTYSVDVYRKVQEPLSKVSDYALYILSFPQMIAGPIVRFNSIADQITDRKEVIDDKLIGFYRFCIGLAKKVLIANTMAEQAKWVFDGTLEGMPTIYAWLGVVAYTFQIYFDFSGYSDMAIGLGKMMGFKFPENFDSPYTSQNISEFWRRWHITLGRFMKDYLYIPLGGNRVNSKTRLYANLWIVFLLSGLWHGASWNFILWGAYHCLFLILDRIFLVKVLSKLGKAFSVLFTFIVVMIGWAIFKLENTEDIPVFFNNLFSFQGSMELETIPAFDLTFYFALFFSFVTLFKWGKKAEFFVFQKESYSVSVHLIFTIISFVLLILCVSLINSSGFNPFIYYRF